MSETITQAKTGESQDLPAEASTPEVVQEIERRTGRFNLEPTRGADMLHGDPRGEQQQARRNFCCG
jgi:hypothetical protein